MAIAPVLKTGVRKDIRVRIPGPPFDSRETCRYLAVTRVKVYSPLPSSTARPTLPSPSS